jgi:hypothetical protein
MVMPEGNAGIIATTCASRREAFFSVSFQARRIGAFPVGYIEHNAITTSMTPIKSGFGCRKHIGPVDTIIPPRTVAYNKPEEFRLLNAGSQPAFMSMIQSFKKERITDAARPGWTGYVENSAGYCQP